MPTPTEYTRRAALLTGFGGAVSVMAACGATPGAAPSATTSSAPSTSAAPTTTSATVNAAGINASAAKGRATLPILTYHQIREWKTGDTKDNKESLICPPSQLKVHLDALRDAGWKTVTADDYVAHLAGVTTLDPKSVLLSFDDGWGNQAGVALPLLQARQQKAVFFVTTQGVGAEGWLSATDIKKMADAGMQIGAHTYTHGMITKYTGKQWAKELQEPRAFLQRVSGQKVTHFAYPYGVWNASAFPHLLEAGYETAFQLIDKPVSADKPLLSLRRILAPSTATGPELIQRLESMAKKGV